MLIQVLGFPSNQTVYYQVIDSDTNIITSWTNTGVTEKTLDSKLGLYVYEAEYEFSAGFKGYVLWKTSDELWTAAEYVDTNKTHKPCCIYQALAEHIDTTQIK